MAARRCTQIKLLPLLLVTSTILGVVQGEKWHGAACHLPDYHGDGVTEEHQLPTGHFVCCVVKTCPKGTYPVICDTDNPSSTSCKECPAGTFRHHATDSSDMYKCEPHNTCSQRGLFPKTPGTIISDAVCGCILEQGYTEPIGVKNPTYCMGPKACPAGEELSLNHSCTPCKSGTFKRNSGFEQCSYWTQCDDLQGLKVFTYGSSTTDSVCQVMVSTEEASSTSRVTTDHDDGSTSRSTDWTMVTMIFAGLVVTTIVICLIVILIKCKRIQIPTFRNRWNKNSAKDDHPETELKEILSGQSDNLPQPKGLPSQTRADPLTGAPLLSDCVNTEEIEVDGPDSDVEEEQNREQRTPPSVSPMQTTELQQQGSPSAGSSETNVTNVTYNTTYHITGPSTINHHTSEIESATGCQIGNGNVANHASEERASVHDATDTTVPSDNRVQYTVVSSESDSES